MEKIGIHRVSIHPGLYFEKPSLRAGFFNWKQLVPVWQMAV
jgi:hypothetical protein